MRVLHIAVGVVAWVQVAGRECGQQEIDQQDIAGCVSVSHMKHIGHRNAVWLGEQLKNNTVLETLDLHHTFIGDDDAISLAVGLRGNTALHRLAMHNNYIRDEGAKALGEALAENTGLRFLSLSSNGVGDEGAKGLAQGLLANNGLRRLDLYFNLVGDIGAMALAKAIKQNTQLRQLHLDSNHIHDVGATSLAGALHGAAGLVELTLSYNQIKSDGAKVLAASTRASPLLTKVTLDHNHMINSEVREDLVKLEAEMVERRRLAAWLVSAGLADAHATSHEESVPDGSDPPLLSPYAEPVKRLNAHHRSGLLQLGHADKAAITSHAALASLQPSQRDVLAEALRRKIAEASQHDEL